MSATDDAVRALKAGRPVIIPTDTVYGIAAMPSIPDAVAGVFRAKGRPEEKPLPVLGATVEDLEGVVLVDDRARRLADRYWPGPLTLVLRRAPGFIHDLGGSYSETVAVRMPACDLALEVLSLAGPLAVTSANASGSPPAHTAQEARLALPDVDVIVDGGRRDGEVSTVLSLGEAPTVVRQGALSGAELLAALDG